MKLLKVRRDRLIGVVATGNYRWQLHKQILIRDLGLTVYRSKLAYMKVIACE